MTIKFAHQETMHPHLKEVLLQFSLSLHECEAGGIDIPLWVDEIWSELAEELEDAEEDE